MNRLEPDEQVRLHVKLPGGRSTTRYSPSMLEGTWDSMVDEDVVMEENCSVVFSMFCVLLISIEDSVDTAASLICHSTGNESAISELIGSVI